MAAASGDMQARNFLAYLDYPPRGRALDAVIGAAASGGNTTLHGCRVMVSGMTVRITREHAAVAALSGPTDRPWDGRWRLDGPHAPDLVIRALGEGVSATTGEAVLDALDGALVTAPEPATVDHYAGRLADARAEGTTTVFGSVQYGDQSWANMRAMGLRETFMTVSFRRARKS